MSITESYGSAMLGGALYMIIIFTLGWQARSTTLTYSKLGYIVIRDRITSDLQC